MLQEMSQFDYTAPAELFVGKARGSVRGSPMRYLRFDTSAEAIKYAVEALGDAALVGSSMVVGDERYEGVEIRALYNGKLYPLKRSTARSKAKVAKP
jgi:hypothetical protein